MTTLQAIWDTPDAAIQAALVTAGQKPQGGNYDRALLAMVYYNTNELEANAREWVAKPNWLTVMGAAPTLAEGLRTLCGPYLVKLFTLLGMLNTAATIHNSLTTSNNMIHGTVYLSDEVAQALRDRLDFVFNILMSTGHLRAFNEDLGIIVEYPVDPADPTRGDSQESFNIASAGSMFNYYDSMTKEYLDVVPAGASTADRQALINRLTWRNVALQQPMIEAKMAEFINTPGISEWMVAPFSTSAVFQALATGLAGVVELMPPHAVCLYLYLMWDLATDSVLTTDQTTWLTTSMTNNGCNNYIRLDVSTPAPGLSPLLQGLTIKAHAPMFAGYMGSLPKEQALAEIVANI